MYIQCVVKQAEGRTPICKLLELRSVNLRVRVAELEAERDQLCAVVKQVVKRLNVSAGGGVTAKSRDSIRTALSAALREVNL